MAPYQRTQKPKSEYDSKLVDLARVTRVSAGGKRFSFRAVVIVGDKKGRVGMGIGKGGDVAKAMEKANRRAEKALVRIPLVNDTIPHEVSAKFGASRVLLKPQQKGRGLVAGGVVRVICEKAGIPNISAKFISKTHNKLNNAMVVMKALGMLRIRAQKAATEKKESEITPQVDAQSEQKG